MVRQRQLLNKGFIMAKIECEVNKLLKVIVKQDERILDLEYFLKRSEKNRRIFAIACARELGVIQTRKEYERTIKGLGRFALVGVGEA